MKIQRWGEGVTARLTALFTAWIFVGWGAIAVHAVPKSQSRLVAAGEPLWADTLAELAEHARADTTGASATLRVTGLANQPVSNDLVGKKARVEVRHPKYGRLVHQGADFTVEHLDACRRAEIQEVPVEGADERIVDDRLRGCTLKVAVTKDVRPEIVPANTPVSEAVRKTLEAAGIWPVNVRTADGKTLAVEKAEDLVIGQMITDAVLGKGVPTELAKAGAVVDKPLLKRLKDEGIDRVHVVDDGLIPLDDAEVAVGGFAGRYLMAFETRSRDTFWTTAAFVIPAIDQPVTWGGLICLAAALAAAYGVFRYANRPSVVELLIETQAEMRKVSWPKPQELIGSSGVVIAFITFVTLYLFATDFVLTIVARQLGLYSG